MKRKFFSTRTFAGAAALVVCLLAVARVPAQQPVQRVVQGKVMDKAGSGIKGAVVYLKDDHTLSVKSFFSGEGGGYRFGQLTQNTDYELWAESNGKRSGVRTISSFDNKSQFFIDLKIE